jgi:hypothetical protein
LHGWGIKILTGQRSFCALLETMQTWVWVWKSNLIYAIALLQSIEIDFAHVY